MYEKDVLAAFVACLSDKNDQAILNAYKPGDVLELSQFDLTSLRIVEICMHLEESIGIDIDLEDFEGANTLADFAALCARRAEDG
jgi:acyl carrier protein